MKQQLLLRISAVNAMLCEDSLQSGWLSLTPCQARFTPRRSWFKLTRRRSGSGSRKTRRALSKVDEAMHVGMLFE